MRYYDLDESGWPLAYYARPQPGKELRHLPERQSEHERWDEDKGAWVEDSESVAAEWYSLIQSRADTELQRGISVTIDGTPYGIRTGAVALSIISGGGLRAERSERRGEKVSRKVPTDKGVVTFDRDGLLAIFEAAEAHQQAIVGRVEELQAMVVDGTIQESDLETGW